MPFTVPLAPQKKLIALTFTALLVACGSEDSVVSNNPGTGTPVTPQETAQCNEQSWFAGVTEICNGVLVYRDYVYDDYGADTGLLSPSPALLNLASRGGQLGNPLANTPGLLSPTAGDSRYPAGAESTADLIELRLSRQGNTYGMIGMAISVVTTLLAVKLDVTTIGLILAATAIGGGVGAVLARKIAMTSMPQLVAAFHSLVGLAAVLIAGAGPVGLLVALQLARRGVGRRAPSVGRRDHGGPGICRPRPEGRGDQCHGAIWRGRDGR